MSSHFLTPVAILVSRAFDRVETQDELLESVHAALSTLLPDEGQRQVVITARRLVRHQERRGVRLPWTRAVQAAEAAVFAPPDRVTERAANGPTYILRGHGWVPAGIRAELVEAMRHT